LQLLITISLCIIARSFLDLVNYSYSFTVTRNNNDIEKS